MERTWIAYYRVSTHAQGQSGLGLEAQQASVLRFVGDSGNIIAAYTDVESGTRKGNDRPALKRAIAHAKRAGATLVIAKLDRLSRNVAFISNLIEAKIDFLAADNPHANKLTIQILACFAEAEAEMISARTKAALQAAKARGVQLGTPANLTIEARQKGAVAAKEASISRAKNEYAQVLPVVQELRQQGKTFVQIAEHLNQQGERTRKGCDFQSATIQRILKRA